MSRCAASGMVAASDDQPERNGEEEPFPHDTHDTRCHTDSR